MSLILRNGLAAAALLAAGIGCFALGATLLAHHFLDLPREPSHAAIAGWPGLIGAGMWLATWLVLTLRWRAIDVNLARIVKLALVLVAIGIAATLLVLPALLR